MDDDVEVIELVVVFGRDWVWGLALAWTVGPLRGNGMLWGCAT